jgi:hypothetical protein
LRPDLVIRYTLPPSDDRWLVVEVKGGERSVQRSARAAAFDLLAYRTAFSEALSRNAQPFGIGIAWGADLEPIANEPIVLCTPDTLPQALGALLP